MFGIRISTVTHPDTERRFYIGRIERGPGGKSFLMGKLNRKQRMVVFVTTIFAITFLLNETGLLRENTHLESLLNASCAGVGAAIGCMLTWFFVKE